MIAKTLSTRTPEKQWEMGRVLGELAAEYMALRLAKIGTPERARRSEVESEMRKINQLHRCQCPGMDKRLIEIWRMVSHRDYAAVVKLSQEWERQA